MSLDTQRYLQKAFASLDAFSIQDIGTFRRERFSAQIDGNRKKLIPPSAAIRFSPKVEETVALSALLVSELNIHVKEAQRILINIRHHIQHNLTQSSSFVIQGVGELYLRDDGTIRFSAAAQNLANAEYFGLQAVEPLFIAPKPKREQRLVEKLTPVAKPSPTPPTAVIIAEPSNKKTMLQSLNWKAITFILLFLALGIFALFQMPSALDDTEDNAKYAQDEEPIGPVEEQRLAGDQKHLLGEVARRTPEDVELSTNSTKEIGNLETLAAAKRSMEEAEAAAEKIENEAKETEVEPSSSLARLKPQSENKPSANPLDATRNLNENKADPNARKTKPTTNSPSTNGKVELPAIKAYHLIAGSYSSLAKAQEFMLELEGKGYTPIILYPKVGSSLSYRVAVYSSKNRAEVQTYSENLRKRLGRNTGYWIYAQR